MKKSLSFLLVGLSILTLVGCNSKTDINNKNMNILNKDSYLDYIDVEIQVDQINDYFYYRWVVTPVIPYEDYLFKSSSIDTNGNFPYEYYVNDGKLTLNLNQYGYAKSKWIKISNISHITDDPYQYLDKTLEIIEVSGYVYF